MDRAYVALSMASTLVMYVLYLRHFVMRDPHPRPDVPLPSLGRSRPDDSHRPVIPRRIWMCWLQGEDHLVTSGPEINRLAHWSWRVLNPTWEFVVITNENIDSILPQWPRLARDSKRSLAAKSDLIRLSVLKEYGGVWADMSVIPMEPLDNWIYHLNLDVGFFTYRFMPRSRSDWGRRETVSWFIMASAGHQTIIKWHQRFMRSFTASQHFVYYQVHDDLSALYDEDREVKECIDRMPQIDERIPHSVLYNYFAERVSMAVLANRSHMYKRPTVGENSFVGRFDEYMEHLNTYSVAKSV